jgi:hypothetical protein
MAQQCFTPGQAAVNLRLTQLFGTIVEWFVKQEYCLAKGGCRESLTLPPNRQTDFFDKNAGTTRRRFLASFLKFHNPALDEIFVAETCEIRKRDDDEGERSPVPDIITHEPPSRMEFYEIKPNSQSGKAKGRIKIQSFQAMADFFRLTVPTVNYQWGTRVAGTARGPSGGRRDPRGATGSLVAAVVRVAPLALARPWSRPRPAGSPSFASSFASSKPRNES